MSTNKPKLDESFKSIMWSYDFDQLDLSKDKNSIILNTINYGNLTHWKWINDFYGSNALRQTLVTLPETAIRQRVQPLVKLIFSIADLNNEIRSTER